MLMRTDPFRDLDRFTEQVLGTAARPAVMPMDAWREGEEFIVEFDLPGIKDDSLDLDIERNVVTVRAERPGIDPGREMLATERRRGVFSRQLVLGENLDTDKDEKVRLEEALALNKPLATAYYMKEDLRRFWEQPGKQFATLFLDGWIRRAEASGIKMLQQMAKTLAAHCSGLLAYYDVMITSGPMEGTNNKIKTMKRQAYGFRDMEFFKLKILAIHESKYALVG